MKTKISCVCVADLDSIIDEIRESWDEKDIVEFSETLVSFIESKKSIAKLESIIKEYKANL